MSLTERIDALLPQTQCMRCGFAGCLPYATAIAAGNAPINRCPPGGAATIAALAALLQRPALPLDARCGVEAPPALAVIDADRCVGCARCLPPCPTDAIVGAHKLLHTVIVELCTGCELCLPACPVDCIVMQPRRSAADIASATTAQAASLDPAPDRTANRARYQSHLQRHPAPRLPPPAL
jgi:Na+-translocating ferredoxin:NAD+ oxidoreductase subunit B